MKEKSGLCRLGPQHRIYCITSKEILKFVIKVCILPQTLLRIIL